MRFEAPMIEQIAEAYWNAFRDGFIRVGGNGKEYPVWSASNDPVKSETIRCLRHAMEVLRPAIDDDDLFSWIFPDEPQNRSTRPTKTDRAFVKKVKK